MIMRSAAAWLARVTIAVLALVTVAAGGVRGRAAPRRLHARSGAGRGRLPEKRDDRCRVRLQ
ncbi:MAG TPA: hypothetical protein VEZ44_13190 [bacterium]|nr:hypothetical protein [bacterium]